MKKIVLFLTAAILTFQVAAQKDPEAKKILDKVSATTKTYKTLKVDYEYILQNIKANVKETKKGSLLLKGQKYAMTMPGFVIVTDGVTRWTYIEDAEEIQIADAGGQEDDDVLTPQKALTIYESGFKYSLKERKGSIAHIDLYPENPKKYNYTMVKLEIDTNKHQLKSITTKGRNGVNYTIKINSMTPNVATTDTTFRLNPDDYDADVIDMRD